MAARSRCRVAWWQVDMWDAVVRGNWRFLKPVGPSLCTYRSSSAPEMRGRRIGRVATAIHLLTCSCSSGGRDSAAVERRSGFGQTGFCN